MTSSMSGFLGPEEQQAAQEQRQRDRGRDDTASSISLAILKVLSARGALPTGELLSALTARPREIISALDDLERARQVRIRVADADDVVELTSEGQATLRASVGE